ncbi:MAG TPA: RidA family protein [Janthinobacterium sp.]|jgi:2-iminobutanoate/2-iminopropanoate deaminase|nr:RidA family protein [Janthinobacterium sp.]
MSSLRLALPSSLALCAALSLCACAPMALHKEVVASKNAPAAIGPYSQAIRFGDMLYVSGQIAIDPLTNQPLSAGSIEDQTKLVIENLRAVLEANGMTLADVVSTQVFVKDLNDFTRLNAVYGNYFKEAPPARATVEVARLPRDMKVEISLIAGKK